MMAATPHTQVRRAWTHMYLLLVVVRLFAVALGAALCIIHRAGEREVGHQTYNHNG
jgi:hypothetical protein